MNRWLQDKYKHKGSETLKEETPIAAQNADSPAEIENDAIRFLVNQEIQKIVKTEDYQILYWYYIEQYTVDSYTKSIIKWTDKEIGEQLEMPLNTVTARRTRALARLRQSHRLQQLFQDLLDTAEHDEAA